MRDNIILKCTECGEENYINTKNKRNHPDRMEVNKYCPRSVSYTHLILVKKNQRNKIL